MSPLPRRKHAGIALRSAIVALLIAALFEPTVRAAPSPTGEVGDVTRVRGPAATERLGVTQELHPTDSLIRNDRIITGEGARLEVLLVDQTTLTLGENGSLVLDDLIVGEQESSLTIRVAGAFRFASGLLKHGSGTTIVTPVATIGIRGTDVWGGAIDNAYGVFLISGSIEVTTSAGTVRLDVPGTGTTVRGDGVPPSDPAVWESEKVQRALESISF